MALVLSSPAGPFSEPPVDTALREAVSSFRGVLTDEQQTELDRIKSVPDTQAALVFTAHLDSQRRVKNETERCIAPRLHSILQSVCNFSNVVGTFVSAHPEIAALVWGSVQLTMQVSNSFD